MQKQFWIDALERAIRTFFQSLAGAFTAGVTVASVDWQAALTIAATATVLSVLMSLGSINIGNQGTASFTKAVEVSPDPAVR
jgi:hypothetical protein